MKFIILVMTILFANNICLASNDYSSLNKLNFCKITKQTENNYEPEIFETTNNLLRETGQESIYCGEKIVISGVVVDQNCVPIADAKVYIWQVDCKGKYPYEFLKNDVDKKLSVKKLTTFTGNGVATTNNKGEFHFITTYPAATDGLSSHVNIRVEHRRLGNLQTRFMLKGYKVNNPENRPDLGAVYKITSLKDVGIYNYKIVMPGNTEDAY